MHVLHDDHGNPMPHGHEHEHEHEHCGACHEHHHDHDHCHEHCHETPSAKDQMTAVLDYMLKHNQQHAAELDAIAGKLRAQGKEAAAEQLGKAVDEFQKGNMYLGLALSLAKED